MHFYEHVKILYVHGGKILYVKAEKSDSSECTDAKGSLSTGPPPGGDGYMQMRICAFA